ncbi:TetR/AcrR family transcriptional regulator [Alicyclobacillus tolerans]|uniref:TetR/AcrR family transcriptional regulator n=1 Tax=Alicyclobacillus tolerans TaxID=90970 RepID=UPI001F3E899C|nr:TetR/AcrR family transcriptional regulator [Alicyclobacillus tolerans]MCF8565069.1 TetR/AcrR family transcriptional regulator [Alicyclobacillus tolerans]
MPQKNIRGKETRARIFEAAAHEFASRGFREVTTGDILAKIGMTQPAFYKHFPNKQALYDELIEGFRTGFNQLIQSIQLAPENNANDASTTIYDAVEKVFAFLQTNPDLTRVAMIQDAKADVMKTELAVLIAENIRAGQQGGSLNRDVVPDITGESLVGMIERLTVKFLLTGGKTPQELAREVVNLLGPALIAPLHNETRP